MKINRESSVPTFEDFTGLTVPIRFPSSAVGWANFDVRSLSDDCVLPSGKHDYGMLVGPQSTSLVVQRAAGLIAAFRQDFVLASEGLSPAAWRGLYYCCPCYFDNLASPRFHASQELRRVFETPGSTDVPEEWLGVSEAHLWPDGAHMELRHLDSESAKAAWTTIAVAQRIGLRRSEVIGYPWWKPEFIERIAEKYSQST